MKKEFLNIFIATGLFSSTLVANENSIVDKTHQDVVKTLDKNIDLLPKSMQGTAKGLVDDINKDGKNINFTAKLSHITFDNWTLDGTFESWSETTQLATVGVSLLPNTWKINLSYSTELGKDLIFASSSSEQWERDVDSYTGTYVIKDPDEKTNYLDFYMQPLHLSFGSFGFGYTAIERTVVMSSWLTIPVKALDVKDKTLDQAATFTENNRFARVNEETTRYTLTYTMPKKNVWYDGLGISYSLNDSNRAYVIESGKSMVLKPEIKSNIIQIGIRKTLDEIDTGFSIKTLTFGPSSNEVSYYDYDKKSNETVSTDSFTANIETTFMKKLKKGKKIYLNAGIFKIEGEKQEYSEVSVDFGLIF